MLIPWVMCYISAHVTLCLFYFTLYSLQKKQYLFVV